jgi:hypothetical protein
MRLCSVHRCYSTGAKGHKFPNPLKDHTRFSFGEWLERVGNTSLLTLDPVKVYTSYRVCELHFTAADYGTNDKLRITAIPSLQIPHGKFKK